MTGAVDIFIEAYDEVGNPCESSTGYGYIIDNTAPTVNITCDDSDNIVNGSQNVTIGIEFYDIDQIDENITPTISILREDNTFIEEEAVLTKINNFQWNYSWDVPDGNDGDVSIEVVAYDRVGNISNGSTGANIITIDNTGPSATSIPTTSVGPWVNKEEEQNGFDVNVDFGSGTNAVEVGDVLELLINGSSFPNKLEKVIDSSDISNNSYDFFIVNGQLGSDGEKQITTKLTDMAGNESISGSLLLELDTVAPSAPANELGITLAVDGYINRAEESAGFTVLVDLTGTNAVEGDELELLLGGASFATPLIRTLTSTDILDGYTFTLTTGQIGADGSKTLTAKVTDKAGNPGTAGAGYTFELDTVAPVKPVLTGITSDTGSSGSDYYTSDPDVVISGNAGEPSAKIYVDSSDSTYSLTESGDWPAYDISLGADGEHIIYLVDEAGNFSLGADDRITLDTEAPSAPTNGLVISDASDGYINNAEETAGFTVVVDLTGTNAVADDVLELLLDDSSFSPTALTRTLTSDDITTGSYTFTVTTSYGLGDDGSKTLTAKVTDKAGNPGTAGTGYTFELDTVAPGKPVLTGITSDTGSSGSDYYTSDTAVVINGTAGEANAHIYVDSSDSTYSLTESGDWPAYDISLGADGEHIIYLVDEAGNFSLGADDRITLDTEAPSAPTNGLVISDASDGYINNAEEAAGFTVVVDLTGTNAMTDDELELLLDGASFPTALTKTLTSTDISDGYTFTVEADQLGTDESKTLTAKVTDKAGNPGTAGTGYTFELDTVAPVKPVLVGIISDTGSSGSDYYTSDTDVVISGNAGEPSAKIYVNSFDSTYSLDGSGLWPPETIHLEEGANLISLVDAAGNYSLDSDEIITLDTIAPLAPDNALVISAASDGYINDTEEAAGFTVVVDLTGTNAVADDELELLLGGTSFSTPLKRTLTSTDISDGYTFTVEADQLGTDESKTLTAKVTDKAGNPGTAGAGYPFKLDTLAPSAPDNALVIADAADGYINNAEESAGFTVVVDLTGTNAVADDVLELLLDDSSFSPTALTQTLTSDNITDGSYTFTVTTSYGLGDDGSKTLKAKVTDKAGNPGTAGAGYTFELDTVAPVKPVLTGITSDTGSSGSDYYTSDPDVVISGNAGEPSAKIYVDSSDSTYSLTESGDWPAYDISLGADGEHIIYLVDEAGNFSLGADDRITLDTEAPSAPTNGLVISDASDGYINNAEETAGFTVVVDLTGTNAVADDVLELLLDDSSFSPTALTRTLTSDDITTGSYTFTVTTSYGLGDDGSKTLTAKVTDKAGNPGTAGTGYTFELDTVAPGKPVLTGITSDTGSSGSDYYTSDTAVVINGTAGEANAHIYVDSSDSTYSLTESGDWPAYDISLGADGEHIIYLVDEAGNFSLGADDRITLDTEAPSAPTNGLVISDASDGYINNAEEAAGFTVVVDLTGTNAMTDDELELLLDGASFPTALTKTLTSTDISDGYTFTVEADQLGTDESKTLTAKVTDKAGNPGTAGTGYTFELDTEAPSAPTNGLVISAASDGYINDTEEAAGFTVVVDLTGTNAVADEDELELLLGGSSFTTPLKRTLTSTDISDGYTFTVEADQLGTDESKTLTAKVTDKASNPGTAGTGYTFELDTEAPSAPTNGLVISAASDGYINNAEEAAGFTVVVDLTGTNAVADEDELELLLGGSSFTTPLKRTLTSTDISDGYTFTVEADQLGTDESKTLTAKVTDKAGNPGTAGTGYTFELDTEAPSAPTNGLVISAASDGYINNAEEAAGFTVVVDLTGTNAVADDVLELLLDDSSFSPTALTRTLTSDDITTGSYTFTVTTTYGLGDDGSKTLTAKVTDKAGNPGTAGTGYTFELDTEAPSAPTNGLVISAASDGYINNAEEAAGFTVVVDLTGTNAVADDVLELLLDDSSFSPTALTRTLTSDDITTGSYTFTVTTTYGLGDDGSKTLTAKVTDKAGNPGTAGTGYTFELDTEAPSAPTNGLVISAASDGYINDTEEAAGFTVVVDLTGTNAVADEDELELLLGGFFFYHTVEKKRLQVPIYRTAILLQ